MKILIFKTHTGPSSYHENFNVTVGFDIEEIGEYNDKQDDSDPCS